MTAIERVGEVEASWVSLRMSVASPNLSYSEIDGLDIFEFFTLLREQHKRINK